MMTIESINSNPALVTGDETSVNSSIYLDRLVRHKPLIVLMDEKTNGLGPCPKPKNDKLRSDYEQIGEFLLICEASLYSVGIPWLPPSSRVCALIEKYQGPKEDFIRESLVSVSTQSLECYVDDLSSAELEEAQNLSIEMPSFTQRYCLAAILFACFYFGGNLAQSSFGNSLTELFFPSFTLALTAGMLGAFFSCEAYRRRSFTILLSKELDRRRGISDQGNTPVVSQIEIEVDPVSE